MGPKTDELSRAFHARFGRQPDGIWVAPGRVNLIGEHTDYNDGLVLPLALPLGVMAAVGTRDNGRLRVASRQQKDMCELYVDGLTPGVVSGWSAYVAGVVWALGGQRGYDILVDGDVPVGAGLSSSAALECATALAISEIEGRALGRLELAILARRAENEFVGVPCGIMDQAASMLCTAGHALFLDVRSLAVEQVPIGFDGHGLALLVIDTLARHELADGEYEARRRSCEDAARELDVGTLREVSTEGLHETLARLSSDTLRRRVRHVVTENARVLDAVSALTNGSPSELGSILNASHASLRDDFQVSSPELDLAVEASIAAGALGARMTGAGFGGCAIALVEEKRRQSILEAVAAAFRHEGFASPHTFTASAAEGARQET